LLQQFRAQLGTGKRLSVAVAAASYAYRWLMPQEMAQYLDTFNLMTYDLHGQWDYFGGYSGPKQHSITGHQSAIYDNADPDDVTIQSCG
jgi:GH18 family chitinase